jgi:hypothetical protein
MIILIFIVSEDVMQLIPCLLRIFRAGSNWVSIIVLIEIHQIKTCACCSLVDVFWFPNHENYFGWSWCLSNPLLWQLMVNPWFLTALTGQIDLVLWWVDFIPLVALDVGIMSGIGWLFALWNGNGIVRSSRRSLISQVKNRQRWFPQKRILSMAAKWFQCSLGLIYLGWVICLKLLLKVLMDHIVHINWSWRGVIVLLGNLRRWRKFPLFVALLEIFDWTSKGLEC